jgi:ubiquinone/menaquinone biosynthesis C-methylase UbiE
MASRDFKQESLRHFNHVAEHYDAHRYGKQTQIAHQEVLKIIDRLQPHSLLDVGCGNGSFLEFVRTNSRSLAGADLSPEMIKYAGQRLGETVDLRMADSEQLPWEANTFDCLTCNYSFHHYPNPSAVLLEMRRVLKVGGHAVFSDPWFPGVLRSLANLAVRISKLGDVRLYSLHEWSSLLTAAGLQIVQLDHRGTSSYVVGQKTA